MDQGGDPVYFDTMESENWNVVEKFVFTGNISRSGDSNQDHASRRCVRCTSVHDAVDDETRGETLDLNSRTSRRDSSVCLILRKKTVPWLGNVVLDCATILAMTVSLSKLEKTVYHALNKVMFRKLIHGRTRMASLRTSW